MSEQSPAHHALMQYGQADEEGIIVTVSRQAIHEVSDEIDRLKAENAELREIIRTHIDPMDVRDEHHDTVEEIRHSLDDDAPLPLTQKGDAHD